MAWQAHGACNVTLVDALVRAQLIRSEAVKAAFLQVDRHWFMPERQLSRAYMDAPQPIGYNVTISAPHMHAIMAEIVQETCDSLSGKKILDVGSGSGYLTAVFAAMVGPLGSVVGVEHVKELVALSERRLQTNFSIGHLVASNLSALMARLASRKGRRLTLYTLAPQLRPFRKRSLTN